MPLGVCAEPRTLEDVSRFARTTGWGGFRTCCSLAPSSRLRTPRRLLRAFGRIPRQDVDLVLVGPAGWNESLDTDLSPLEGRVHVPASWNEPELEALSSPLADVFCLPSSRKASTARPRSHESRSRRSSRRRGPRPPRSPATPLCWSIRWTRTRLLAPSKSCSRIVRSPSACRSRVVPTRNEPWEKTHSRPPRWLCTPKLRAPRGGKRLHVGVTCSGSFPAWSRRSEEYTTRLIAALLDHPPDNLDLTPVCAASFR